jgi:hypothetical protein
MTENWSFATAPNSRAATRGLRSSNDKTLYVRPGPQEIELQLLSSAQFRVGQLTGRNSNPRGSARRAPRRAKRSAVPEFSPTSARSDADLLNDQLTVLLGELHHREPARETQQARIAALGPPPPAVTVVDTSTFTAGSQRSKRRSRRSRAIASESRPTSPRIVRASTRLRTSRSSSAS